MDKPPPPAAPPEFILEAFADPISVREVIRGILHTIFFHRMLQSLKPETQDILDLTLPHVSNPELETLIEQKASAMVRQLDAERHQGSGAGAGRGQVVVQFFERRRRKTSGWNPLGGRGDEEVCWESWTVKVTVAEPRTETGTSNNLKDTLGRMANEERGTERAKVRRAAQQTLQKTVLKIVTYVNTHMDHIPPITTTESNPFPYQIHVNNGTNNNGKDASTPTTTGGGGGWAQRMGIGGLY